MIKYWKYFLLFLLGCGYQQINGEWVSSSRQAELQSELEMIQEDDQLKAYLQEVLRVDQKIRERRDSVLQCCGREVPAYERIFDEMRKMDAENAIRIDAVIDKFGFPKKKAVGARGPYTAALVIHHTTDLELREKHIQAIYQAYLNDDIDHEMMLLFLERTYHIINGVAYPDESGAFRYREKIDKLMVDLGYVK